MPQPEHSTTASPRLSDPSTISQVWLRPDSSWKFRLVSVAHIIPKHPIGPNHRDEHGMLCDCSLCICLISQFNIHLLKGQESGSHETPYTHTYTHSSELTDVQSSKDLSLLPVEGEYHLPLPILLLSPLRRGNSNRIGLASKTSRHVH